MVGNLIIRGIIVGIVAGLLAFGWAKVFGEPSVEVAIGFESSQHEAHEAAEAAGGHSHGDEEPEMFSRDVQSGIGLLTGLVVVGAGLGGMFGVLFAFANGRIGGLGPAATSALMGLFGLVAVYLVPALKYPANPPSVGEADTIQMRTALYFLMMAISIALAVGAWMLRGRLAKGMGVWNASVAAAVVYVGVLAGVFLAMPTINEVPAAFPAVTLWNFRMASLGIQAVLWLSIGVLFGYIGAPATKTK